MGTLLERLISMKMWHKNLDAKVEDLVEQLGKRTQAFEGQLFEHLAINMSA